uniref:SAP domain-containing protein n=1 Tax=Cebus imitator TaxID=2715852 RepID=A0A2K5PS40_CEBIM
MRTELNLELHKLKLAELKQECLALETKGIKQDLIHRLQAYLEEHTKLTLGRNSVHCLTLKQN